MLACYAPMIATDITALLQDPMAGDEERNGIGAYGGTHRPNRHGFGNSLGDMAIGSERTCRYLHQCSPDINLKISAADMQ